MEFHEIVNILCVQKKQKVLRAELGSKKSGAIKFKLKTAFFRDVHTGNRFLDVLNGGVGTFYFFE